MEEFLTTKYISELLKVHVLTVRRWIDNGMLPAYKIGKEFRIKKEDFENFLKNKKV
ncbi:MAG: helix-turn-helix domain-containing protein [Patescibacteria group bacterium]|nr:helix-turn-helix domain-containing protein [Patescibacteria group bacterium]